MKSSLSPSAFRLGSRAVGLLCVTAFFVALGTGLVRAAAFSNAYFWRNELAATDRRGLLVYVLALPVLAGIAGTVAFVRGYPRGVPAAEQLYRFAVRTSPLGPLAMVPWLLRWDIWAGHDLAFCVAAMLVSLALGRALTRAIDTLPLGTDSPLRLLTPSRLTPRRSGGNLLTRDPFLTAAIGASALYIAWFAYHTVIFHLSCRTGWDTSIEDNILWNMSHGGPFFKASPALGPTGAHFRRHATLISYFLVPFYLLKPGAATVLVIQSVLQGLAAVPLFLFARRHLGAGLALLVSVAYLFHPALQESNLFEVHYLKFGPVFLFTTLWLLDSGRNRLALLAAFLTMLVREDVASWAILVGLWGLMSGRDPRFSGAIAALGSIYVGVIKFIAMPAVGHGEDELTFIYRELVPSGGKGFGAVLGTVFGNPAFTLESLFDPAKLIYFLQVFLPLAFIPLRRTIGWLAVIPGAIFCFISTHYSPFVDIHFQYSAHILTFAFPALVLVLADTKPEVDAPAPDTEGDRASPRSLYERHAIARRYGLAASMLVATLIGTYQYGAVLQQNTSRGGPVPYKFGWDDEGRARRNSVDELMREVPPLAPIAASAFTIPQVSARPDAFVMTLGLWNAEYILAPSGPSEHLPEERAMIKEQLSSGNFGVLKVVPPFFLAKRGANTAQNQATLEAIHAR